ncbi:MAG: hypothetical protein Q8Q92_03365 [bacterium]|nr:hypothetical protein [bacterium]
MSSELPEDNKRGFKIKIKKNSYAHSHKLPLFCPREECRQITSNLDDEYLVNFGICGLCYAMNVENRKEPLIDVEFYKKRLQERGF